MLGSIYIGLSGMSAYSSGLQTISNNVANLNTAGFKATSVAFTDLFSHGDGDPGDTVRSEIGNGVRMNDSLIDFSQGDLRQTDNDLDLAVDGKGFMVLLHEGDTYYARTGQFAIDEDGYIAEQVTGYRLAVLDDGGRPVAVDVDGRRISPPEATTKIIFADNLSSSATQATVADIAVYDSSGGKQAWTVTFAHPEGTPAGQWAVTVKDGAGATLATSTLKFIGSIVDSATAKLVVTDNPAGADPLSVELDFSTGVTSFSGGTSSTLRAASVDGKGTGTLANVAIDEDGQVKFVYSNEDDELAGAVAIADFRDPQLLEQVGEGIYRDDGVEKPTRMLAGGQDGLGKVLSKRIEESNTDLSKEFGRLIIIQRGFQASSQVISISNDMIQQLFGIRGQG